MMPRNPDPTDWREITRLSGVQTSYRDAFGKQAHPSREAILAALGTLGAEVNTASDIPGALRRRRFELATRFVEPVMVTWEGRTTHLRINLPAGLRSSPLTGRLLLEDGTERSLRWDEGSSPVVGSFSVEGAEIVTRSISLLGTIPWGYHRLELQCGDRTGSTLVISAPDRAFVPNTHELGVFIPLYALRSRRSWGIGDLSDLRRLGEFATSRGIGYLGTLPLLPSFVAEPFDPSPYAAISRLFWSELYVDPLDSTEFLHCTSHGAYERSDAFQRELNDLNSRPLMDYRRVAQIKLDVLARLARCCRKHLPERYQQLQRFAGGPGSTVRRYARFRALCDRHGAGWGDWPGYAEGELEDRPGEETDRELLYLYAQWLAASQVAGLESSSRAGLYIDLPLGVHAGGFDTWAYASDFAFGASAGAPPDAFFTGGQNWGFPPMHPDRARSRGYDYMRAYLRHHMRHSAALRIDHVMGLHRLYWIPDGVPATDGVYVRYPAEEMYAILTLESQRHGTVLVGEDLGTVPRYVRRSMKRRGLLGMYVSYFESEKDSNESTFASSGTSARTQPNTTPRMRLRRPSPHSLACVNTHDLPPFAAFASGEDIQTRYELGWLNQKEAEEERQNRARSMEGVARFLARGGYVSHDRARPAAIYQGLLRFLAGSPARIVLINLEDLFFETKSQNIPGTSDEHPNWRRRAARDLEDLAEDDAIKSLLRDLVNLRA